jgi:hypothetical protein
MPFTLQAEQEIRQFIDEHPRGKHGQVKYHLEADFGISPNVLRKRFDFYFKAFSVQAEAQE